MRVEYSHDSDRFDMTIRDGKWWDVFPDKSYCNRSGYLADVQLDPPRPSNLPDYVLLHQAATAWNRFVYNFKREMER